MTRPRICLFACLAVGMALSARQPAIAQFYFPFLEDPPPRDRSFDQPRAVYGAPPQNGGAREPGTHPRAGFGRQDDRDNEPPGARPPGGAAQGRARVATLPPDADPNYSTPVDYDDEVDQRRRTARIIADPTGEPSGAVTINTQKRKLYLSLGDGRAVEYRIGVGREGFVWKGVAEIGRKAFWPGWTPPPEMLVRRPDLPKHMDGGLENPLGARALYLFTGTKDTLFRIHGTNEPNTIGHAVSSGCIRMHNTDVIDLYDRVKKGARVVVM